MATCDAKTDKPDIEDQNVVTMNMKCPQTRRDVIVRALRDLTALSLLAGLIYICVPAKYSRTITYYPVLGNDWESSAPGVHAAEFDWYALKPSEDIKWRPCFERQKCARLSLPLDYLTLEGPKTEIALRIIPATDKNNYKGTILVNPGGPGVSGTDFIRRWGTQISKVVGPEFDVLGFDPRGTGATTPPAQCFATDSQLKIWNLQDGPVVNLSDGSVAIARTREKVIGEICAKTIGGNGKEDLNGTAEEWGPGRFMSTASVATDMLRIVEKLGQDKLQYWGFSYGTVLGQYFSAMYPDKVGRVVIDGVCDANRYRARPGYTNLEDTDAVLASFFDFCHQAGPSKCAIFAPTVGEIHKRVEVIIQNLSGAPIPIPFASKGPAVLTKKIIHFFMLQAIYSPLKTFKALADTFLAIESGDIASLTNMFDTFISSGVECNCKETIPWLAENEAFYSTLCGDADYIAEGPGDYESYFRNLTAKSYFAAPLVGKIYLKCAEWKLSAKWRYTDQLAGNTSHPLLIVSPAYDPVCPLKDAKSVQKRYTSGLLQQNSYGHCSFSAPSLCTAKYVRNYFLNGKLPVEGTICEPDELPLVGKVDERISSLSNEDAELLEVMKALGDAVPNFGHI